MKKAFLFSAVLLSAAMPAAFSQPITFQETSDVSITPCKDYFREAWGTALTMDGRESGVLLDVPAGQTRETSPLSYSGGTLNFRTLGRSPLLTLLQNTPMDTINNVPGAVPVGSKYGERAPIDSSTYRYFTVRMKVNQEVTAALIWSIDNVNYGATTFKVYPEWRTYIVDLATSPLTGQMGSSPQWTSRNWHGFEFIPTNLDQVDVEIDWIQLLSDQGCGSETVSHTYSPSVTGAKSLFVLDNDTTVENGYAYLGETNGSAWSPDTRLLMPGSYKLYGFESTDWSTSMFGRPIDFSRDDDVLTNLISPDISNWSFSNGRFVGTNSGADPYFFVNLRNGQFIDADKYKYLSIGVEYTLPSPLTSNYIDIRYQTQENGPLSAFVRVVVNEGYQVINIPLPSSWSGQVRQIRIDPVNDITGATFSFDFIEIRSDAYATEVSNPTKYEMASNVVLPDYKVNFIQPDARGGKDFAQTELNNAWLMDDARDVVALENIASAEFLYNSVLTDPAGASITGDFFRTYNIVGDGDPGVSMMTFPTDHRVNTDVYRNFCIKGWNKTDVSGFNSVARFFWHRAEKDGALGEFFGGDDIIFQRETSEYCLDLTEDMDTRLEPPLPGNPPNPWTSLGSTVDVVRFDMNEIEEADYYSVIDVVTLRSDHEAPEKYNIVIDAPVSQPVSFYYVTSRKASGGTLIGTLAPGRSSNVFTWNTTDVPEGRYYLYAESSTGASSASGIAPGRIHVSKSLSKDTENPILNITYPASGQVFDSQLSLKGYALDNIRLALVEVLIDDELVSWFLPDHYDDDARTAYPNYADSNDPGFLKTISTSSLTTGSHTLKVIAHDTAGNKTSFSTSVTKTSGQNESAPTWPIPTGQKAAVEVPTPAPTATPVASAKISLKNKKGKPEISVTDAASCNTVSIVAGSDQVNITETVLSTKGQAVLNWKSKKAIIFKKKKKKRKKKRRRAAKRNNKELSDGKLFLSVACDGIVTDTAMLKLRKKGSGKKAKTEKAAIKQLSRLMKLS